MMQMERLEDEDLKFTVFNYVQVLLCSFTEAWQYLERMGDLPEVCKSLRVASPAIDRIRKWKGLYKIRSMLIAHPTRDSDRKFTYSWDAFAQFDAPTNYAEILFLGNCALRAGKILLRYHHDAYESAWRIASTQMKNIDRIGITTVGDIKRELQILDEEMASIESDIRRASQ